MNVRPVFSTLSENYRDVVRNLVLNTEAVSTNLLHPEFSMSGVEYTEM